MIIKNSSGNPVIPLGKRDSYYTCKKCGTKISVQYDNCTCGTSNPNIKELT